MSVEVLDFGCRLNIAEGAHISRLLDGGGAVTVINGCAVTGEAMRQTAQAARRAKRARPGAKIVVTGCAAQVDAARFAAMPEVDQVLGNHEKMLAASYAGARVQVAPIAALPRPLPVVSGTGHTRSFVEVQTGCDHRCTFCIIPAGRGDSVSISVAAVVAAIASLVDAGQREVVLTGVDLTSYRPSLAALVTAILRDVPALPRLRLSSLDPAEIDPALFDLLTGEPRIMPHIHLSLQSGDALTLKRMKRRHTPEGARRLVEHLKTARPEIAIGADLIAGFPTETDAMHRNNAAAIDDCDVVFGHIFPYSPREGTLAARMPQVPRDIGKARAAELRAASAQRKARWLAGLVGTTQSVLVEKTGLRGHAGSFADVALTEPALPGSIVDVRIVAASDTQLTGAVG